jgi:hypothetical protein
MAPFEHQLSADRRSLWNRWLRMRATAIAGHDDVDGHAVCGFIAT